MYITPSQYIIFIGLCYLVLRMPSKYMTSRIMERTSKADNEVLDANKHNLKGIKDLKQDCKPSESSLHTTAQSVKNIFTDFCFLFLYHITTRKPTESILATTALFFWKVSAFPVNCTASSSDRKRETEVRIPKEVSTRRENNRSEIKGDCETDWVEFRENCYQVNEEIMNFKFAQEYCNSLHSQVVNIQTMSENIFIRNLTNNAGIPGYLWIGVHKVCLNCSRTIDGYTNWAAGQPNGVSKCVMMDSGGQWHDFDCGYKFAFVCEKALSKDYTRTQMLIALLVPIFSCLTVAISFTTALLVSSVRRGGQPFKVASRYRRTKKERRQTNWDMIDMLRRASLTRRGSRLKPQRASAPSIEITKVEDADGKVVSNGMKGKRPWYKRGSDSKTKTLEVPDERRQSNNSSSSGNSSLYELLARLNKMEFEPPNETRIAENDEEDSIELKDLSERKNGFRPEHTEDEGELQDSQKQLVDKGQTLKDSVNGDASFRNMAFRDSVVSVDTNGSGIAKVTSVQQLHQRDSVGKIEDITIDMEHHDLCSRDQTRDRCSRDDHREETGASGNIQTVRVDVHNSSNDASVPARNGNVDKRFDRKAQPSKGKVTLWTYSL